MTNNEKQPTTTYSSQKSGKFHKDTISHSFLRAEEQKTDVVGWRQGDYVTVDHSTL